MKVINSLISISYLVFLVWFSTLILVPTIHAKESKSLLGDWVLNLPETERLRPELPKAKTSKTGFGGNLRVGVPGGPSMPLPSRNPAGLQGKTTNMPRVLSCENLNLSRVGEEIHMLCDDEVKPRKFKIGKHHGRKTKWNDKSLKENYSSTSRWVKHEFVFKKDRMHVNVMVKPKGGKRLKYLVVFDRKETTTS